MPIDRLRLGLRAAVIAGTVLAGVVQASAGDRDGIDLPADVRPFTAPLALRFGGFDRFTYTWREDMDTPRGRVILEGWIMQGDMHPQPDGLHWSYSMSNIGRDGVARERATLRAVTDPWGAISQLHVVTDRWPSREGSARGLTDSFFDSQSPGFMLCCCPSGPIRMGQAIEAAPQAWTTPGTRMPDAKRSELEREGVAVTHRSESVAAGILDAEGRRYLAIRHQGGSRTTTPAGEVTMQTSGYSLIDTRTCLPRRAIWRNAFTAPGRDGMVRFSTTHLHEVRF